MQEEGGEEAGKKEERDFQTCWFPFAFLIDTNIFMYKDPFILCKKNIKDKNNMFLEVEKKAFIISIY